jgi:hypothetical protein
MCSKLGRHLVAPIVIAVLGLIVFVALVKLLPNERLVWILYTE